MAGTLQWVTEMRGRYSSLKALRFPEQLRALSEDGLAAPVHIRIKPINACNHHCWYCAYRADNLELGSKMELRDKIPDAKMDEIVGDIIAMGTPGAIPRDDPNDIGNDVSKQHGPIKVKGLVHMQPGSIVEVEISGIGTLRNPVVTDRPHQYRAS